MASRVRKSATGANRTASANGTRAARRQAPADLADRMIAAVMRWHRLPEIPSIEHELYRANDGVLTQTQLDLLSALCATDSLTMRELSAQVRVDPAIVSRNIPKLVDLGLAQRTDSDLDRRQVIAVATEAGRRAHATIVDRRRRLARTQLSFLPADELPRFVELFEQFVESYVQPELLDPKLIRE